MLPLVGELNWFKDLVLPVIITFACSWVWSRSGRLLRYRKSKAIRKRAADNIAAANVVLTADYAGGYNVMMMLKVTHLIVRCAAFLFAFNSTLIFYVLLEMGKESANGYAVAVMGGMSGILLNMIRTAWDDIHRMAMAYAHPVRHVEEITERFPTELRSEFDDQLKMLRTLAEQISAQRRGRISAELLVGRLIGDADKPSTAADHPSGSEVETSVGRH